MTRKLDSGIHDLAVCKYSNFCFFYYLHILDSGGCLGGEKGWTFRKSKILHGPQIWFSKCLPFFPGGFFTFLAAVAHGAPPMVTGLDANLFREKASDDCYSHLHLPPEDFQTFLGPYRYAYTNPASRKFHINHSYPISKKNLPRP